MPLQLGIVDYMKYFLLFRSPDSQQEFSTLLLIAHHYAARTATAPHQQLAEISTKILVSLLRHTDLIPADKVDSAIECFHNKNFQGVLRGRLSL